MKTHSFLSIALLSILFCSEVSAQSSPDQFYRPVSSRDLITILPPRVDQDKLLSENQEDFLSFGGSGGGCPDEILIGSVDGDASIFGGVDIEVVINNDIIVDCGGL